MPHCTCPFARHQSPGNRSAGAATLSVNVLWTQRRHIPRANVMSANEVLLCCLCRRRCGWRRTARSRCARGCWRPSAVPGKERSCAPTTPIWRGRPLRCEPSAKRPSGAATPCSLRLTSCKRAPPLSLQTFTPRSNLLAWSCYIGALLLFTRERDCNGIVQL